MEIILWNQILQPYQLAVDELVLKFEHIQQEYAAYGEYCPIQQVSGRVKSIASILDKMRRKEIPQEKMEELVEDIAGVRIICQFVEDIEQIVAIIRSRSDMEIVQVKDYLLNQKASGYRSYHLIIAYKVATLKGSKTIHAEIQIRTMAMDFWATIEHHLQYKYKANIPAPVRERLSNAAQAIMALDNEMSSVRGEIVDAQLSSQLKYHLTADVLNVIEGLYGLANEREILKIQTEFLEVYKKDDIAELERYQKQLDSIAEGYRVQKYQKM